MNKSYFKTFFVCPSCEKPVVPLNELKQTIDSNIKFCGHCGQEIASTLKDALATIENK